MRCRVPILLCVTLLVCAPILGVTSVAGQPQAEGTHLEAQLQDNGDAAWNVTFRIPIEDDEDRADFEAFAERFEAGETDPDLGVEAFERAAEEASTASDREMRVGSIRREGEIVTDSENGSDAEYGELRVAFVWESFARQGDDGTLYVDDAFNTTDGTWLPGIGAQQTLTIRAPPGYGGPTTSPIGADGGDLRWEGPQTFEPGYFTIVYHPSSSGPTAEGISDGLVTGALLLSGAALVVGLYLLFSRRREGDEPLPDESEEPSAAEKGDGPASGTAPVGTTGATEGTEADDAADRSTDSDERGGDTDPDLLSDEERVEYLLERNGGRMKQATIVKETGWSNAKVSQLLSSMDDADRVDKLRIGRENLISLPGEGVGEFGDNEA